MKRKDKNMLQREDFMPTNIRSKQRQKHTDRTQHQSTDNYRCNHFIKTKIHGKNTENKHIKLQRLNRCDQCVL